jgi:hypothetical protein
VIPAAIVRNRAAWSKTASGSPGNGSNCANGAQSNGRKLTARILAVKIRQ